MEELQKENERLKKSLNFVDEQLEYTYNICERYQDPWLTICTGSCFDAFMTDYQMCCSQCLKKYCKKCWTGSECDICDMNHCKECLEKSNGCPESK